jgi:hypothetical protein
MADSLRAAGGAARVTRRWWCSRSTTRWSRRTPCWRCCAAGEPGLRDRAAAVPRAARASGGDDARRCSPRSRAPAPCCATSCAQGPARVRVVPSANPWVHADLDRPEDLRAAVCALHGEPWSTVAQMFRHRSHRAYRPIRCRRRRSNGSSTRRAMRRRRASSRPTAVVAVRDARAQGRVRAAVRGQPHIVAGAGVLRVCADLHKIAAACGRHGTGAAERRASNCSCRRPSTRRCSARTCSSPPKPRASAPA